MSILQQILLPTRYWSRVFMLSVSIVLLAFFITISLSHFETKYRIGIIEYQHRLIIDEMSRISDSSHRTTVAQEAIHRLKHRKQYMTHLSSLGNVDKLITELEQIKRLPKHSDYDDQNGRPDFALGTAGAQILSVGNTDELSSLPKWLPMFGFRSVSKYFANGAHRVIQPSIHPGECFAFTGPGEIIIKLIRPVFIDAVSIEHILANQSPDGSISNAPSIFHFYGMLNDNDSSATLLGTFTYDIEMKQSLQQFSLPNNNINKSFPIVKFEFVENQRDNYTCVYRVRVHGSLVKPN